MKDRGIFCTETGDWGRGLARNTGVQPALDLLAAVVEGVSCFRRDAATRSEIEHYLAQWTHYSDQPILYLTDLSSRVPSGRSC